MTTTEQRRPMTRTERMATLRDVARVYLAAPMHPTKTVAMAFGFTHDVAAKRVQSARLLGLIPETTIGSYASRHGDHVARSYASADRKVVLCDACLVRWPCPEVAARLEALQ